MTELDGPDEHLEPKRPMSLDRRLFLAMLGATGATAALAPNWFSLGSGGAADAAIAPGSPAIDPAYPHGIASGDPLPDGSVIWTRVEPAADLGAGVPVTWQVSTDDGFTGIVASGVVNADATADHTVHVTVTGLAADRWYHYRFSYADTGGAHVSRTGRLRTAPAVGSSPDRLRFAFCSCQQINASYYVAHAAMAAEDLDFVVHYGDYIYVSDGGTLTLDQYRAQYRRFKENPWLQELHATYPMVVMWDDGEFVNGIDRTMEPVRFAAARRAWFEFMPVARNPVEADRTYREIVWGDLLSFLMLDVRQYRDVYIGSNDDTTILPVCDTALASGAAIFDPDRTCLGAEQKSWLVDKLRTTTQTWRHIGHGYPFVPLRLADYDTPEARANPPEGFHVNGGQYPATEDWDGYWAERRELMDLIAEESIPNVIASSGQTHIYFGAGIRPDYDDLDHSPVVMWEFTTGSLTADPDPRSQFFPDLSQADAEVAIHGLEAAFLAVNPQIDFMDLLNQGYGIITVTPTDARVDFRIIDTFDSDAVATTSKTYRIPVDSLPTSVDRPDPETPSTTVGATTPSSTTAPSDGRTRGTGTTRPVGSAPAARSVPGDATYTG